jgi:hypothetical protein
MTATTATTRPRLEKFFARVVPARARLSFALDATASRQETWDMATKVQAEMFAAASGLEVQLAHYRGLDQFVVSAWTSNSGALAGIMTKIFCRAGPTQIRRVLEHAHLENQREKVNALIIVSDACEEHPGDLYDAARALCDVPVFLFQEGDTPIISEIYGEIAKITGGALARFDAGAASRLADLLKAVAAYASGGMTALAAQKTEAATLLLGQVKR